MLSLRTSALGSITSALGGLALRGRVIAFSGPLAPLGVLVGKLGRPVQRLGELRQEARGVLRPFPRMSHHKFRGARFGTGIIRIVQLGPSTLELRSAALIPCHLTLKLSPLQIPPAFPELRRAIVIPRRELVTVSSIPMDR